MVVRAAGAKSCAKVSRKAEKKSENGFVNSGHPVEAPSAKVQLAEHQHFFEKPRLRGLGIGLHGGTYCTDFRA